MMGLSDGGKNFEDMYNRLNSIPACDRRTDRQTNGHLDTYAYASRGKNQTLHYFRFVSLRGTALSC